MIKRIHVNMHVIRSNRRDGSNEPPLSIKTSKRNIRVHSIEIHGPSRVIYRPEKPLACGARVWVETTAKVTGVAYEEELELE